LSGVGAPGVPTERSTMPSGCARARSPYDVRWSHGKSGSLPETGSGRDPIKPSGRSLVVLLRRQRGDEGVVLVDHAHLGGATGRAEVVEELDVRLVVVLPLLRGVVLVEDRLDGADGLAGAAVHALVGVDVEHPLALVDAVDRALLDARLVEQVDARLRDDVGHRTLLLDAAGSPDGIVAAPRSGPSIANRR